jgi:hypothetical protein
MTNTASADACAILTSPRLATFAHQEEAVDAEPEECNTASDQRRRHGDQPLDDIPSYREVLESQTSQEEIAPRRRRALSACRGRVAW